MTAIVSLQVPLPHSASGSYTVRVGTGVAVEIGAALRRAAPKIRRVGVLSDSNVWPLHGEAMRARLDAAGVQPVVHIVAAGEGSKSAAALCECIGTWANGGVSRTDATLAFGGGVVGDLGGLAAHLFMRGVPIVQCPTSLLAMVDASVGGKVAIDHPVAKNLVGAFHFPAAVLVDPGFVATLPAPERIAGAAEMVKHALLFSADHFAALFAAAPGWTSLAAEPLAELVATSIALKVACVAADPFERAPAGRVLLNLGHTVGHALESVSGYTLGHGPAVALGIIAAARLSCARSLAAPALLTQIVEILAALGLPTDLDRWLADREPLRAALAHDKKRGANALTYIALADIGNPQVIVLGADDILSSIAVRG